MGGKPRIKQTPEFEESMRQVDEGLKKANQMLDLLEKQPKRPTRMRGTIPTFDVDFSPCQCPGTKTETGFMVIEVCWQRLEEANPSPVLFTCGSCFHTWRFEEVFAAGVGLRLDVTHPEEIARRAAIPNYEQTQVNTYQGANNKYKLGEDGRRRS